MSYTQEIKRVAKSKHITLKKVSEYIGMTEAGFHRALKKQSLKVDHLLKICELLAIDPASLFVNEINQVNEDMPAYGLTDRELLENIIIRLQRIEGKIDAQKNGKD